MTDGIPGFYTVDGFYKVLLPQLPVATRQVASESWVLGKQSEIDPSSPQVLNLQGDVVKLYTNDYAKQWDGLLNDIDVKPLTNLQQAVQALYVLSSPQSPMRDLLAGIPANSRLPRRRRRRRRGGYAAGATRLQCRQARSATPPPPRRTRL